MPLKRIARIDAEVCGAQIPVLLPDSSHLLAGNCSRKDFEGSVKYISTDGTSADYPWPVSVSAAFTLSLRRCHKKFTLTGQSSFRRNKNHAPTVSGSDALKV